ncbi:MAG: hypothetical protein D6805_02600 [Planctomycetota bacterium]|nr:MAG: hypothetical protein D6805_02600 [Planctomycetota bacterium]
MKILNFLLKSIAQPQRISITNLTHSTIKTNNYLLSNHSPPPLSKLYSTLYITTQNFSILQSQFKEHSKLL